ncbi:MAG: hypothetical protein M3O28_14400 [Actinomycetota bacterium]|nr:hypothetical protein [Actinomycetota bacterium]
MTMLSVGWLVFAVLVAVLLTMWVTFTLTRLDRLHARVDAAQAALDAQLVRRAAALQRVADSPGAGVPSQLCTHYERVALEALAATEGSRQRAENAVGRAMADIAGLGHPLHPAAAAELREAAARVLIARRFYNDAVRDTRTLRAGRMPRLLRLAGHRSMPVFFDIDDTVPAFVETAPQGQADRPIPPDRAGPHDLSITDQEKDPV